jgi:hypothetical protein
VIPIRYNQDQDYIAFKDRSPAAEHHILVIPRIHVGTLRSPLEAQDWRITLSHFTATVKVLHQADIPMRMSIAICIIFFSRVPLIVTTMKEIATRIFDDLGVPPEKRRYALFFEPSRSLTSN